MGTLHLDFHARIILHKGTRFPLQSLFLFRMASISGRGFVVRQLRAVV